MALIKLKVKAWKGGAMSSTIATRCLVCDALIEVVDAYESKQLECPECGEVFRVVSLEPLQLTYAYDLNEEGEYDDEDRPHR
jgi:predicted RNA-binding Zn-ribbon protein involved in translation (DUF1610 family)